MKENICKTLWKNIFLADGVFKYKQQQQGFERDMGSLLAARGKKNDKRIEERFFLS